jgi:hypothetical protein
LRLTSPRFAAVSLRAELWWLLPTRFENTYEHVVHGIPHKPEEMISIPNHEQLIAELSMPLHFFTETGKVQIESEKDMQSRGWFGRGRRYNRETQRYENG